MLYQYVEQVDDQDIMQRIHSTTLPTGMIFLGHKILNGQKRLEFEKGVITEVKMSVQYMSFSAHADAKGKLCIVCILIQKA